MPGRGCEHRKCDAMTVKKQIKATRPVKRRHAAESAVLEPVSGKPAVTKSDKFGSAISAYHEEILSQNEQLREAQFELEQSRDRYARLYEEAPVGYVTLDQNGVVEKANLTALKLLGASRETVVRRPLLVFVHEEDRGAFLNFLLICRSSAGPHKQWVEVRLRRLVGGFASVQLSSVGVCRDSGKGTVFLTALTDITGRVQSEGERRKTEEKIAQAVRERAAAQAANDAKDRFLAMLSHELRTPLTPVMLRLSAMVQEPGMEPQLRDDLNIVLNNIKLEVQLIDDLLDLSRILRGKFEPQMQEMDLRDVIRQAMEICDLDIRQKAMTIVPNIFSMPLPVRGDQLRLQQVFWNILRNAIKFTPNQGTITLSVIHAGDSIRVRVQDTGMGIEPNILPRIFGVFEQGNNAITRRYGGLGLGLTISKAILDAHGGSIEATSAGKDHGATFTVVLPAHAQAIAEQCPSAVDAQKPDAPAKKPLRILLVEDHDDTRLAVSKLLTKLGYDLSSAANAAEATTAAAKDHFDLVISDLGLPDIDGYELMRQLRAQHDIKGIALSGFGMEGDQLRSKEVGFAMHMVKPVTIEALQKAIHSIFATS